MILCDIGNTNVHINENGKIRTLSFEEFKVYRPDEVLYYINVNQSVKVNASFVNLAKKIKFRST